MLKRSLPGGNIKQTSSALYWTSPVLLRDRSVFHIRAKPTWIPSTGQPKKIPSQKNKAQKTAIPRVEIKNGLIIIITSKKMLQPGWRTMFLGFCRVILLLLMLVSFNLENIVVLPIQENPIIKCPKRRHTAEQRCRQGEQRRVFARSDAVWWHCKTEEGINFMSVMDRISRWIFQWG